MKIITETTYEAMCELTASILLGKMCQDKRVNMALTAGSTPRGIYELLAPTLRKHDCFSNVHYYTFDEVPIVGQEHGLTLTSLSQLYFTPAQIAKTHIHPITTDNYHHFAQQIEHAGGLDLMMLGIGADGHFCANMPGTTRWQESTYRVDLTQPIPEPWYQNLQSTFDPMPDCFVTMGARSIMQAKHLLLIANGSEKATIINKALTGPIDPAVPASVLQLHPNLTVVLDEHAAVLLPDKMVE
ncbi:MAG: glucosamine-6-phosphate deaminase [Enterobacteriaceae bacterium]